MKTKLAILALLLPALLAQAAGNGSSNGRGANRARGKVTGEYSIVIAGQYTGRGSATVTEGAVTLAGVIFLQNGATGVLTCGPMKITNDRFTGTGTVNGVACTVTGRVDLPDARDEETTDEQALTGRLSATVRDTGGKTARVIGIQNAASRGGKTPTTGPKKG